ncbi:hypothetical protein BDQ17DRAFT_446586 [Cyathus striatus]|nr:hypothetical protein BDQ17DRAFT_446586 [Cyathus striatus]
MSYFMHGHTGTAVFVLWLLRITFAGTVNRTIDDSFGDSTTSQVPMFLPSGLWANQLCEVCAIKPDTSKAFMKTYTASTYYPTLNNISISMEFEGIAIYVFFILPNKQADGNVAATTIANFTIDGQIIGDFTHNPDPTTTDILYNQLVFNKTDLPNAIHQLVISTSGLAISTFTNFDYAIYSCVGLVLIVVQPINLVDRHVDHDTTASVSPTTSITSSASGSNFNSNSKAKPVRAIVGGTVGGIIIITIIAFLLFRRLRTRKNQVHFDRGLLLSQAGKVSTIRSLTPFLEHSPRSADLDNDSGSTKAIKGKKGNYNITARPFDQPSSSGLLVLTSSESVIPTVGSDTPLEKIRQARQSELDRRLHAMNKEMDELRTGKVVHPIHASSATVLGDDSEISRMQEHMQAMQAQVELLQSQQQSPWAQGLSNNAPPGYVP